MTNGSTNEDAVTEGESQMQLELSPEAQASLQEAVDAAMANAAAKARAELEPVLRAEQEEKARLEAEAEAARIAAEAETARLAAEEEEKRLAEEEALRIAEEARKMLVAEQTPRAVRLLEQRYFRAGFGHEDIDAVLRGFEPEAVATATEKFNAQVAKLEKEIKDIPVDIRTSVARPLETKVRRSRR